MSFWKSWSLKKIFFLLPLLNFIFLIILVFVSNNRFKQNVKKYEALNEKEFSTIFFLNSLGNRINRENSEIHKLFLAHEEINDEGEFYDKGKKLLNNLRRVEQDLIRYIDSLESKIDKEVFWELRKETNRFVLNISNALLAGTANYKETRTLLEESINEYYILNDLLLRYVKESQDSLKLIDQIRIDETENLYNNIFTLFLTTFFILLLLAYFGSQKVTQSLTKSIESLTQLMEKSPIPYETKEDISNEVFQINQVVGFVEHSFLEMEKLNKRLNYQQGFQQSILNHMMDPVITISEYGIIQTFNKAAEDIFGYESSEVLGKNIKILMPEPDSSRHDGYLAAYMGGGPANIIRSTREVHGKRKDGTIVPVLLSVNELPDTSEGRFFIGSCKDLSEIKRQEGMTRQARKLSSLGTLTGGIAHDFNNMLNVIMGYADIIYMKLEKDSPLKGFATEIKRAAQRGAEFNKKLLDFSKDKLGSSELFNLNTLILNRLGMIQKLMTSKVNISAQLSKEECVVKLNEGDLENAIVNMCINSMHAIGDNGDIHLITEIIKTEDGEFVVLKIRDNGKGMTEKEMELAFDPFFSTKEDVGTGLGLSQVYGFVKRSNGEIEIESELGEGTTFLLTFPLVAKEEKEKIQKSPEMKEMVDSDLSLEGLNIVIVDDDIAVANLLEESLLSVGINVFKTNDPTQVQGLLESNSIDFLISDMVMPKMNGFQVAEKAKREFPELLIILATGYNESSPKNPFEEELLREALRKPYEFDSLLGLIRKNLKKREESDK